MLRTRPFDDDVLFQIAFEVTVELAGPPGRRQCATFAKNNIEAMHLTRNQFGAEYAAQVSILEVTTRERERNGTLHTNYIFPTRRRETIVPDDLPAAAYG